MSRFFTSGDQSIGASASHPLASGFFTTMPPGKPKMKALVGQSCPTLCDPVDCSLPRSSGYSFPSPRDLPDPGIKPRSPALQADSLPSEPTGKHLRLELNIKTNIREGLHSQGLAFRCSDILGTAVIKWSRGAKAEMLLPSYPCSTRWGVVQTLLPQTHCEGP